MVRVRNAVAVLAVVALAPLVVTGVVGMHQFREAYRARVVDHLEEMIDRHSQAIDAFLNDRLSDIRVVSREYPIERLEDPEFLRRMLNLMREEYHGAFVDFGVVDSDGVQTVYAGPFNLAMADYSSAEWFQLALEREWYVSDVFAGLRGTPHFIVASQRGSGDNRRIVKATIDFEAFNALVENIRIGRTGFAFIFNRLGEFQTIPRFEVGLNRAPYADLIEGTIRSDIITTVEGADLLGRRSLFTLAPLKQGEWFLCYQQEVSDAFAELQVVQTVVVTVFLVVALATVFLSYTVSRRLAVRLAAADSQRTIMTDKVIETGRLASIGELAAGIAHEINNPVAIMVEEAGWIEDLLEDGNPSSTENVEEIARAVRQIRTQGDRCKEITYKLLSFARKTDSALRDVDVNALVEEVLGVMGQKTRYANVKVETDLGLGLPPVCASRSELQQVLLNLVNNAVDAIGEGGGTVTVVTRLEGRELLLVVADTGAGIPEANIGRIFDPFFTTKPVGQGTGLGLSICYGIVDKIGGRITVESEVDAGTTFAVYLPAGSCDARARNGNDGAAEPAAAAARGEEK